MPKISKQTFLHISYEKLTELDDSLNQATYKDHPFKEDNLTEYLQKSLFQGCHFTQVLNGTTHDTIMHKAARERRINLLSYIQRMGGDLSCQNRLNETVYDIVNTIEPALTKKFIYHPTKIENLFEAIKSKNNRLVKELINEGVPFTNSKFQTALHLAAIAGNLEISNFLISGVLCDPDTIDIYQRIPLHYAVKYGRIEVVECLIKFDNSNIEDIWGMTPILYAAKIGRLDILKILYQFYRKYEGLYFANFIQGNTNKNILHIAVEANQLEVVKYLCSHCQKKLLNWADANNLTPFQAAKQKGFQEIENVIRNRLNKL